LIRWWDIFGIWIKTRFNQVGLDTQDPDTLDIFLAQFELGKQTHTEVGHSKKEAVGTVAAKVVGVLVVKFDIGPQCQFDQVEDKLNL